MPIKRPDGKPLELDKPNPLLATQDFWDFDNETIYLHNFKKPIAIVIQEKHMTKPTPRILTKELIEEKPKTTSPPRKKMLVHCLKAVREEHIDDLYGDKYHTINYKGKFTFEAILINVNDLSISLWSPTDNVTDSSIIFPEGDMKWWKINSVKPSENGFLLEGTPSIDHPDFSD